MARLTTDLAIQSPLAFAASSAKVNHYPSYTHKLNAVIIWHYISTTFIPQPLLPCHTCNDVHTGAFAAVHHAATSPAACQQRAQCANLQLPDTSLLPSHL
jgi:hypothetical protein